MTSLLVLQRTSAVGKASAVSSRAIPAGSIGCHRRRVSGTTTPGKVSRHCLLPPPEASAVSSQSLRRATTCAGEGTTRNIGNVNNSGGTGSHVFCFKFARPPLLPPSHLSPGGIDCDAPVGVGITAVGSSSTMGMGYSQARMKSTAAHDEYHFDSSGATEQGHHGAGGSADGRGQLTGFVLTDIGEGIMEVEVLQWFVRPGDHVHQFDKICEVQSDKANVEITSRYDGIVRNILWNVGDMVQTGSVLVEIEESAIPSDAGVPTKQQDKQQQEELLFSTDDAGVPKLSVPPSPSPRNPPSAGREGCLVQRGRTEVAGRAGEAGGEMGGIGGQESSKGKKKKVLTTPAVRRLCREMSIDLDVETIRGTGPAGRVLKADVLAHAAAEGIATEGTARAATTAIEDDGVEFLANGAASGVEVNSEEEEDGEPLRRVPGVRVRESNPVSVPIKGIQRAMMEAMQRALEVPHMTFCDEINADRLSKVRSDLKEAAERRGVRLSYLPLIVKATSMSLTAFPTLNASLSEDKKHLLQHPSHNIGVAMDTPKGLLVPCISAVQEMSVLDVAEELNNLQRLGAEGKLGESELSGTTFTLSNIGSIGGTYASPVILHPQVCIGALGRMQRVPRFDADDTDKVVAARVFPVSWSADHRVVDGGTLARFSNSWKAYLENPALMLGDAR